MPEPSANLPEPAAPPPERHPRFPSAVEAFWLLLVLMLLQLLLGSALGGATDTLGLSEPALTALVLVLSYGVVFSLVLPRKGLSYGAVFHAGPSSPLATVGVTAAPLLLLTPGLVFAISTLQDQLIAWVPMSANEQQMFERMSDGSIATTLTACLIAPLLEELLFRGVMLRSFLAQYRRWPAVACSAALFALAHLNLYQGLVGLLLGMLTGWLYERTRSVGPGLLLHMAYNGFIAWWVAMAAAQPDSAGHEPGEPSMAVWVLALVGLALGLRWLSHLLSPSKSLPSA